MTNRTVDIDLSNYVDNGEWELVGTKIIRNVHIYPCCPEPFPDVVFYLHIRRRVLYYLLNVIIPCMLLSSLSLTGKMTLCDVCFTAYLMSSAPTSCSLVSSSQMR